MVTQVPGQYSSIEGKSQRKISKKIDTAFLSFMIVFDYHATHIFPCKLKFATLKGYLTIPLLSLQQVQASIAYNFVIF